MSNKMNNKKRAAIIAVASLGLLGGGLAMASWTASGSGNGSATADTATPLVVTGSDATGLFPTGSTSVTATVKNNNPYAVSLSSINVGGITSNHPGCNADSVTADNKTLTDRIAAGGERTYTFTVRMDNSANDFCQNAVFTVPFTATGASTS